MTDCLVRYAAVEYGPRKIKVNSILPGPIMSKMTSAMLNLPGHMEQLEREIPLNRVGYPEDDADAVQWLVGPFVAGLNIPVAGGLQLARFPYPDEVPVLEFVSDSGDAKPSASGA